VRYSSELLARDQGISPEGNEQEAQQKLKLKNDLDILCPIRFYVKACPKKTDLA
jgi:hypothetical protein